MMLTKQEGCEDRVFFVFLDFEKEKDSHHNPSKINLAQCFAAARLFYCVLLCNFSNLQMSVIQQKTNILLQKSI